MRSHTFTGRVTGALLALLSWGPVLAAQTAFDPSRSDPKAVAIADQVMEALGGKAAWDAIRYLRFDFAAERQGRPGNPRAHTWDKHTGRYRLEGKTQEGDPFLVLMNLNTKEGSAWLKGTKLEGEELKKYLDRGYGAWVNDTYWLLMPYKMKDPGVILAYDGEEKTGDGVWDKVVLTFDNVGLTPKDKYWAYVNQSTRLVDRWAYILKGGEGPPTAWEWKDWQRFGAIMLARDRVNAKDGARIYFSVLEAPASIPEAAFTSPDGSP